MHLEPTYLKIFFPATNLFFDLYCELNIRCLKSAFNADCDGQAGIQELAGNATLLYYLSQEGAEGKDAFLEKRDPDFRKYPWLP